MVAVARGEAEAIELGQDAGGAWVRVAGEPIAWRLESGEVLAISPTSFRSRRLVDRDRLDLLGAGKSAKLSDFGRRQRPRSVVLQPVLPQIAAVGTGFAADERIERAVG